MQSLDNYAPNTLAEIKDRHFHRTLNETVREEGLGIDRERRRLRSFTRNDYFGLTQNLAVKWITISAIEKYDVGSDASRLVARTRVLAR